MISKLKELVQNLMTGNYTRISITEEVTCQPVDKKVEQAEVPQEEVTTPSKEYVDIAHLMLFFDPSSDKNSRLASSIIKKLKVNDGGKNSNYVITITVLKELET
jgi:hypothetical protein